MKRIPGLVALLVLALTGCAKKPAPEAAAGADRRLTTAKVERTDAAAIVEVDGTVVGATEAILSSRLAAPVVEVLAVPGQTVRAGAVLVRSVVCGGATVARGEVVLDRVVAAPAGGGQREAAA